MDYQQFNAVPAYELAVWADGKVVNRDALKWGGKVPPPAIGAEIVVIMNNLGPAVVTGYFTEGGWLGLLCRLKNPPEWHRRQNAGRKAPSHIFGPEFRLP